MKWTVARCVTIFKEDYCDQKKMLPFELKRETTLLITDILKYIYLFRGGRKMRFKLGSSPGMCFLPLASAISIRNTLPSLINKVPLVLKPAPMQKGLKTTQSG